MSEETKNVQPVEGGEQLSLKEQKQLEKQAHKARKSEIKHILLGNFTLNSNGLLGAGSGRLITPFGMGDGAGNAIVYGIAEKVFRYKTKLSAKQAIYRASKAMADIGRGLVLENVPNAAVCYVKSYLFRPVVLVFEEDEKNKDTGSMLLTAYSARSFLTVIGIHRAVTRFENVIPEEIERNSAIED